MTLRALITCLRFRFIPIFVSLLIPLTTLSAPHAARAQQHRPPTAQGYVTAVNLPASIDVNHVHILLGPKTVYLRAKDNIPDATNTLRDSIRAGDYLFVFGAVDPKTGGITAQKVLLGAKGWLGDLSGTGVIQKIVPIGTELVIEADGYRIRITPATAITYSDGLKSLADVKTDVWLKYEGKLDENGTIVATRVRFIAPKLSRLKRERAGQANSNKNKQSNAKATGQKNGYAPGSLINANGSIVGPHTKVRYGQSGGWCAWQKLVSDEAMQARVARVGFSVVPTYQKKLPPDNLSKIQFRFFAVDPAKIHSELVCNEGVIFVPKGLLDRLKDDNQLAAVLADGVAFSLQMQWARLAVDQRLAVGIELAECAALIASPIQVQLGYFGVGAMLDHGLELRLQRQRDRIALSLMAAAGYDPWQAPEAWRLLAPKHLPKKLSTLKYPDRSQYQLEILNLEYRNAAAHSMPAASTQPAE